MTADPRHSSGCSCLIPRAKVGMYSDPNEWVLDLSIGIDKNESFYNLRSFCKSIILDINNWRLYGIS